MQMVSLWKDPEGKTVFSAHEAAMQISMLAGSHSSTQVDQEMDALRQKVKQLKDAVEQYKVKLKYNNFIIYIHGITCRKQQEWT